MFEGICISRQEPFGMGIDIGFLAEALVFYQRVLIVADGEMFKAIVRICGHETIIEMMEMGILTIDFIENIPVVSQDYDFGLVSSEVLKYQHVAPQLLQELTGKSGKGRRIANRMAKLVRPVQCDPTLPDLTRQDASDSDYVEDVARSLLEHFVPEYQIPSPCVFRFHRSSQTCTLETNIDFEKANVFFKRRTDVSDATLTPAYLLSYLAETRKTLTHSAEFSTDLAVSTPISVTATCKFKNLIEGRGASEKQIQAFEDLVFRDSRCIREAVNSGDRTFDDVLRLVTAGMKFKEWLNKTAHNGDVVKEYCREVTRIDWAEKLPPKAARWAIFAAASAAAGFVLTPVAGAAVGVGLSAGDYFLLDKVVKGWKPNQFVNGPLKDFGGQ
jgi:hypothetical protein